MALIRLAYASDLPTPEETIRKLSQTTDVRVKPRRFHPGGGGAARFDAARGHRAGSGCVRAVPLRPPAAVPRLARFDDVIALARSKRDIQLVQALERDVRLARFEQGSIAFTLVEGADPASRRR